MNRLFLVRHGENLANLTKEFSHKKVDYSLTTKGRLQAEQTAAYFSALKVDGIFSSPLRRAVETAEIIAASLEKPVGVMEEFREVNVGNLEDLPPSQEIWTIHDRLTTAWLDGHPELTFPGGENYFSLWGRMRNGLIQILSGQTNRTFLIVGHGGIFTFTLKDFCPDLDASRLNYAGMRNCSITELETVLVDEQPTARLIRWGDVSHLSGLAAQFVSPTPD